MCCAMAQVYDEQLWSTLEQVLLIPLSQRIETDLRLQHHAALLTGVPAMNPLTSGLLDVTSLLEVDPLHLSDRQGPIHIRCPPAPPRAPVYCPSRHHSTF